MHISKNGSQEESAKIAREFSEERYRLTSNLENRLNTIYKLLGKLRCKRILDVGCGTGIIGASISKKCRCEVFGLDIDEKKLVLAQRRGLIVKKGDIEKETFLYPSEFFDVVICSEVIEHVTEYNHVLSEIYRVLEKNGILILSTPNLNSGPMILEIIAHGREYVLSKSKAIGHVTLFSPKSLRTSLAMNRFRIDKVRYVNYPAGSLLGLFLKLLCFAFPSLGFFIAIRAQKS